eukprot:8828906-Prorocentrum_lima.AAC.1
MEGVPLLSLSFGKVLVTALVFGFTMSSSLHRRSARIVSSCVLFFHGPTQIRLDVPSTTTSTK